MLKIFTIIVIFILAVFNSKGQNNNKLLEALIQDSAFCKFIMTCGLCDTIYIVDTSHYFDQGVNIPAKKKVIITTSFPSKPPYPMNRIEHLSWGCKNFFITDLRRRKRYYRISYFHALTNHLGFIEYKFTNRGLVRGKHQFGVL